MTIGSVLIGIGIGVGVSVAAGWIWIIRNDPWKHF